MASPSDIAPKDIAPKDIAPKELMYQRIAPVDSPTAVTPASGKRERGDPDEAPKTVPRGRASRAVGPSPLKQQRTAAAVATEAPTVPESTATPIPPAVPQVSPIVPPSLIAARPGQVAFILARSMVVDATTKVDEDEVARALRNMTAAARLPDTFRAADVAISAYRVAPGCLVIMFKHRGANTAWGVRYQPTQPTLRDGRFTVFAFEQTPMHNWMRFAIRKSHPAADEVAGFDAYVARYNLAQALGVAVTHQTMFDFLAALATHLMPEVRTRFTVSTRPGECYLHVVGGLPAVSRNGLWCSVVTGERFVFAPACEAAQ